MVTMKVLNNQITMSARDYINKSLALDFRCFHNMNIDQFYQTHSELLTHNNHQSRLITLGKYQFCARCSGVLLGYVIGIILTYFLWESNRYPLLFIAFPIPALIDHLYWIKLNKSVNQRIIFITGLFLAIPIIPTLVFALQLNLQSYIFVLIYTLISIFYFKNLQNRRILL